MPHGLAVCTSDKIIYFALIVWVISLVLSSLSCFVLIETRFLLCSPGCLRTQSVGQSGLELRGPPSSAPLLTDCRLCLRTTVKLVAGSPLDGSFLSSCLSWRALVPLCSLVGNLVCVENVWTWADIALSSLFPALSTPPAFCVPRTEPRVHMLSTESPSSHQLCWISGGDIVEATFRVSVR